jgi:adenosylcobinamide kinase/adenosylcobinamide-phosphate guanylyltransferase
MGTGLDQKNMADASIQKTLVTGGAKSGKSRFAEALVTRQNRPRIYIATAEAWDDEMRARIEAHRADRGAGWTTIEAPHDLVGALAQVDPATVVLVDCVTLWLSNLMLAEADMEAEMSALLHALASCPAPVIVVTNEVGWSIVPENALARRFRDLQGQLNQKLAQQSDRVIVVIAGLPFALKGTL